MHPNLMPQDIDDKEVKATVGRTYRGEAAPPITTPEAVAARWQASRVHASKPGAVALGDYFVIRGHNDPILQASMLAYTDVRVAPVEDFDAIFARHHDSSSPAI